VVRSLLQLVDLPFVSAPAHSPSCSSLHWNICLSHEEEEPAQWERRTRAPVQTNTHKARARNHVNSHMCSEQLPQLAMALSAVHQLLMEHWPLNSL